MKQLCLLMLAGLLLISGAQMASAEADGDVQAGMPDGDAARGRLIFGPCRTCHYAEKFMGHNNGPNLNRIFGKVAGKQPGFDYYSELFRSAEFVWTPELMYAWLENPRKLFPESSMMSLGVPDPQRRADLIAFLMIASVRGEEDAHSEEHTP
jgi:cytochrome c